MKIKKKVLMLCVIIMVTASISPIIEKNVNSIPVAEAAAKICLNKKKATLYVGESLKLKVKGTKKSPKWSSSKKSVATVSSKGKVKGKKKGTATITAKVDKKKYKCKVTVKAKGKKKIPVSTIVLSETQKTVPIGAQFTLSATIVPINATNKKITWQSINSKVATVKNGVVKAIGVGTTQIFASSDNGISVVCKVKVTRDYIKEFACLNIYERGALFAMSRIDETMKASSKSYTIRDGGIGQFQYRGSVLNEYETVGKAAVKVYYMPSDFQGGIVPNYVVYITDENKIMPYGAHDDRYNERWLPDVELGEANTHTAVELYEIFVGLQQSGYNVARLCNEK